MDKTETILEFEISRNRAKAMLLEAEGLANCAESARQAADAIQTALEAYRREHEQ